MDIIFDIDGTLADATHRLHFIKAPNMPAHDPSEEWRPNWDMFLSDEMVAKDKPIGPVWRILDRYTSDYRGHIDNRPGFDRILFITGRKESSREMTREWLNAHAKVHCTRPNAVDDAPLFMRSENDRRPSHMVKRDILHMARQHGYDPLLVFEDRADDTRMWREEGLICCQVAEGNY